MGITLPSKGKSGWCGDILIISKRCLSNGSHPLEARNNEIRRRSIRACGTYMVVHASSLDAERAIRRNFVTYIGPLINLKNSLGMLLFIKKNDGTTLTIDMLPHDSIGELLKEIEAEFDWSQDRLALNKAKLFYRGSSTFC
ncbi:unnamed protein product [Dracunculus medinensis]|uniref:FERM domain-containing protein n=1 Tax=Dracunculus medinensis TaxID=318479 RepID=A0A0N4UEC8_DRAME|nr:unnamed protein product [Dracunculus medinensis]